MAKSCFHRVVATAVSILLPLFADAALTMRAPAVGGPPMYFSGTNCKVKCSAIAAPGNPKIVKANLWIGGTRVAHYDPPPPGENEMPQSLAAWEPEVVFSSLVFQHNSFPVVLIEAQDLSGTWYSASYTARVHNLGMSFGRTEFEMSGYPDWHGCANSVSGLLDLGHSVPSALVAYDHDWAPQDFFDALTVATAVYVHTHGVDEVPCFQCNKDSLEGVYNFIFPSRNTIAAFYPEWIQPPNMVLEERAAVTGIDDLAPPFNSSGGAPIGVAFLDFCFSSSSSEWSAFVMHGAWTTPTGVLVERMAENTAVLGWVGKAKVRWARQATATLWLDLAVGCTVAEARHHIVTQLPPAEIEECVNMPGPYADAQVMGIAPSGTMPQHLYARLGEYVYTGDITISPYLWYK